MAPAIRRTISAASDAIGRRAEASRSWFRRMVVVAWVARMAALLRFLVCAVWLHARRLDGHRHRQNCQIALPKFRAGCLGRAARRSDELVLDGKTRRSTARAKLELAIDRAQVGVNCPRADHEALRHLGVAESQRH
jgi:hypothetical protein